MSETDLRELLERVEKLKARALAALERTGQRLRRQMHEPRHQDGPRR
jgi:hypothetical protein